LNPQPIQFSFEFFPPRDAAMEARLWQTVERLTPLKPVFVSVTYGADGSTRERTHEIVTRIHERTGLVSAPHLTCVGASRDEVLEVAQRYWDAGIRHVVALRGDPPKGSAAYVPHPQGFAWASELVAGLKTIGDFEISVAAYPEIHPEARSADADLENLRRKVDAGASRAITQFFFDPDAFLRFRDRAAAAGIGVPIVPGVLPITRFPQMLKFAAACGASVPVWLQERFEGLDDDADTRAMIAASVAIDMVETLRRHGVADFHFYTLNRAELVYAICHCLTHRPAPQVAYA
jgi:methylenetetrahydrofolate reductase (NADPH)